MSISRPPDGLYLEQVYSELIGEVLYSLSVIVNVERDYFFSRKKLLNTDQPLVANKAHTISTG